jgi:hypothetical protein
VQLDGVCSAWMLEDDSKLFIRMIAPRYLREGEHNPDQPANYREPVPYNIPKEFYPTFVLSGGIIISTRDIPGTNNQIFTVSIRDADRMEEFRDYLEKTSYQAVARPGIKKHADSYRFLRKHPLLTKILSFPERVRRLEAPALALVAAVGTSTITGGLAVKYENDREACNMVAQGKALDQGDYLLMTPHFQASGRTPDETIKSCRERFEIVITPEKAQASFDKTFGKKEQK